ncbi:MAG: pesticidal protein Cry7Aa [Elusimicrobiota bacterium]
MIKIKSEGILLEKTELAFENQAVLNPACIEVDGSTHMFYRAVNKDFVSSIGYCRLVDNKVVQRNAKPVLFPEYFYERRGVEDPRIVFLDGTYYLFYTVYDGKNALFAYATSADLKTFVKRGIISPNITYIDAARLFNTKKLIERYFFFEAYIRDRQGDDLVLWEKDVFLFPKKINGKFALIHRVLPGIQLALFNDFSELNKRYWEDHLRNLSDHVIMNPHYKFESRNIGGGCPPIETEDGWLLIYHAVEEIPGGRIYHAAAALLDINDPFKIIGRLPYPLFSPVEPWEKTGDVNNVVFPSGAVVKNGRLYIYYGAADSLIAAKSVDLKELLTELKSCPPA